MISSSVNRQIGSIFLIVGTEIGAGVLALPILISHVGVALGTLLLLFALYRIADVGGKLSCG